MNYSRLRYYILFFGISLISYVMVRDFKSADFIVKVGLWNISPYIIYFITTIKLRSKFILITPAVFLCSFQLLLILEYFFSHSSTAALIFIFAPIYEIFLMGIGFFVGYLLEKRYTKRRQKEML